MKQIDLVISHIDDVGPFPDKDDCERGKTILRIWMTEEQIAYNRMVLLAQQIENRGISKIRAVK